MEEIKESHNKLQELHSSILMAIPHAIIGLKERTITFANDAVETVFGWKPDELIGKKTRLLYRSDEDYEEIGKRFYLSIENKATYAEDFPCRRKDGQEILCRLSASVIGKKMLEKGIVIMYEDITDRKKAEEELNRYKEHLVDLVKERTQQLEESNVKLQALDRMKSMFIASMSHELRTPLNSIIGFIGMTLQGLSGELNEEQRDNLSRSYQAARHLLSLITDIIDISKIEAGRIESYPEVFPLKEIIDEALVTVEPQLKEKKLTMELELPADLKLNTDRKRLLQCIINLLSNGVKFTEQGGITITVRDHGPDLEISFADTGIGIAKDDLPKLFEAFERLETHLRVKAGGTGLGLYLTKKLVMEILHGGISVQSKEGQGSTFTLRVPKDLQHSV